MYFLISKDFVLTLKIICLIWKVSLFAFACCFQRSQGLVTQAIYLHESSSLPWKCFLQKLRIACKGLKIEQRHLHVVEVAA
jgi:hypothetical protein